MKRVFKWIGLTVGGLIGLLVVALMESRLLGERTEKVTVPRHMLQDGRCV